MNRAELVNLLFSNLETITLAQAAANLATALVCAVIIYVVYFYTSNDTKPTAAFAKTVLIVTLCVSLIVMLIGSNLALSLGMVGALSVIRFRAAVKDSRDAAFIFYAIAVGMASALGLYLFSLLGTLFIGLAVIIFSFLKIGSRTYLVTISTDMTGTSVAEELKKAAGKHFSVMAISAKPCAEPDKQQSAVMETVYEVGLKNGADTLCRRLSELDGVLSVSAVLREDV